MKNRSLVTSAHVCSRKSNFSRHNLIHSLEKSFSCDQCLYTCNQKSYFIKHKLMHSGKKPFACDHCSYTCNHKRSLILHMLKHSAEKPLSCPGVANPNDQNGSYWTFIIAPRAAHKIIACRSRKIKGNC